MKPTHVSLPMCMLGAVALAACEPGDDGVQYATRRGSFGLAIDHVVADRASGSCTVFGHDDGFGPDPGTMPLDDGFDWTQVSGEEWYPGRIGHFAILCDLEIDFTME